MRIINVLITSAICLVCDGVSLAGDNRAELADVELNQKYQSVMQTLSSERKVMLREAQRAWIKFRDKTCAFESEFKARNDSGWIKEQTKPNMDGACIQRLTLERVAHLRNYLAKPDMNRVYVSSQTQPAINSCEINNLPKNFTVQAVGVYEGSVDTDINIDPKGNETKAADVTINRPNENVLLVLMAYDPVVWRVKRTKKTNVVGVLVGGYHPQAVFGIERSVPLYISTHIGRNDCGGYFFAYKADARLDKANAVVKSITGREIDHLWANYTGREIYIGPAPSKDDIVSSDDYSVEDYTSESLIPSGKKGINRLIKLGKLRRATDADISAWVDKASEKYQKYNKTLKVKEPLGPQGVYVVLNQMTFPSGLYGANSVSFILPVGIPFPSGSPGHSAVYSMESGLCQGPICQR